MGVPGFQGNDGVPVSTTPDNVKSKQMQNVLHGQITSVPTLHHVIAGHCHCNRATLVRMVAGDNQEWTVVMGP